MIEMTKKDDIPEISQRIKQLRERLDLSQKALGKLVGVTDAAVTNWETGIRFPRGNNLKKLARALGVSVSDLSSEDNSTILNEPSKESKSDMLTELYSIAPSLDEPELRDLLVLARGYFRGIKTVNTKKVTS